MFPMQFSAFPYILVDFLIFQTGCCFLDRSENASYGEAEIWRYGDMEKLRYRDMETWRYGEMHLWRNHLWRYGEAQNQMLKPWKHKNMKTSETKGPRTRSPKN